MKIHNGLQVTRYERWCINARYVSHFIEADGYVYRADISKDSVKCRKYVRKHTRFKVLTGKGTSGRISKHLKLVGVVRGAELKLVMDYISSDEARKSPTHPLEFWEYDKVNYKKKS